MTSKKVLSCILVASMITGAIPVSMGASAADTPATVTITPDTTKDNLQNSGSMTITLKIKQDITPTVTLADWQYKGTPSTPEVTGNTGNGEVTYLYKAKDADDSTYSETVPTAVGQYTVKASIAETADYKAGEATADFEIKPYSTGLTITLKIKQSITPTVSLADWQYKGTPNTPEVTGNSGNGEVTYLYKAKDADNSTYSETVPTAQGSYTVKAVIAETDEYKGGEATADFEIKPYSTGLVITLKIKQSIEPTVSLTGWTYGGTANTPEVTGNSGSGDVTYLYKLKTADDEAYSETVPTAAGEYTVKAVIAETDEYKAGEATANFTIAKATPTPEAPTNLTAAYGKTLADVELPDGWAWDNPSTSVGNVGSKIFSATLTPTDTANYNTYTTYLTVNVTAIPATPGAVAALNATYGDTLADVDLPTPEDGTWAWKDDTTSVGNAGEQTFKAVFTPSSPNYTAVEQDVTINVAKADPTPDAVTGLTVAYGKKLSDVTLPDGWTWDAPATSVGNVGNNPFAATYTPTDTDNYNTLNQNLTVNVVAVDKTSLNEAIAAADTYLATIKKTVYADPAMALTDAIAAANAVSTNDNVTEEAVAQAITDVNNAVTTAKAAVKDIDDTKAAQAVTDKINALPAAEAIKSTDKEAVEAARAAYANLTEAQSAKVTKAATDKLTAAEKAVADHIAADAVIEKINAIGEIVLTNDSKALIDAARTAYEALATDAQKALVSNYTTLTADEQKYSGLQVADVKAKIDAIGDIELSDESKAAIDTARAAFKALNADQQALVANAKVLDYAEKLYEALDAKDKADKDKAAAEKNAETAKAAQAKAEEDAAAAKTAQATAEKAAADAKTAQTKAEEDAAAAKTAQANAEKAQATAEKAAADAKTAQTKAEEEAAAAKTAQANAEKAQATAEKAAADAKTAQTKAEEEAAAAKTAQATAEKAAADAKTAQTKAEEDAAAAKTAQAKAEEDAAAAKAAQATAEKAAADAKTAQTKAEEDAATAKTAQATAEKNAEAANSKVSDLTEQLAAAVKQIEELESSGNVDEALKKQVAELKEQLDAAKTAQNEANEALAKAQDVAAAKIAAAEAAQEKAEEEATAAEKAQATAEQTAKEATEKAAAAEKAQATAEQTAKEATEKAAAAEKAQATAEQTAKEATEKAAAAEKAQATAEQTAKEATEKAAAAEKAQATAEQTAKEATEKAAAAEKAQATAEQTAKEATEKAAAAEEAQKVAEAAQAEAEKKAAENKAAADQAAADKVIKLIDAIGNVEKTNTSENKIVAARAAYDALTDEQKALVTNYTVLTKAESAYKTLPQTGMSGFHKVFAGLAALMGITGMGLIKKSRKEDEEE